MMNYAGWQPLGLLPAALSHEIGSDSQRPFAIVIVRRLISDLLLSIVLFLRFTPGSRGSGDHLPRTGGSFEAL